MPVSQDELDQILTAPTPSKAVELPDVWPTFIPNIDTSKIDMIAESLKNNLNTKISSSEPEKALRQIFGLNTNEIDAETFVKICSQKLSFIGYEEEVKGLFRRLDVDREGKLEVLIIYSVLNNEPKTRAKTAIGKVREVLMKRAGGISSLKTLGIQFKLLDHDGNGTLNRAELEEGLIKFMKGFKALLSKQEIDSLFKYFDADGSNSITYDEFLRGIRGNMAEPRLELVKKAFSILDLNGDGKLTLAEIAKSYNVSENPLVKSGKISEVDALRAFIAHWHIGDKSHTDFVSLDEFIEYYQWVSSSIDSDEYFELMMRNAWHISGGKGAAENTSNIRVLVTHEDGHQTVEEVKNDFGISRKDSVEIKKRLAYQGIKAKSISLHD